MIEREHFKTCVRAYFPEHDFYWLDRLSVDYVACICLNGLGNLSSGPNEEQSLLRILRRYASYRQCDPRTLTFVGEEVMLHRGNDTDFNLVLVLKDINISPYERQFLHPFY